MTVLPARRTGTLVGAAIVCLALGVALLLARATVNQALSLTSFTAGFVILMLVATAVVFAYWAYGCWSLRYVLDRNYLTIRWAGNSQQVPLEEISTVVPGNDATVPRALGGIGWPGYRVGRGRVPGFPASSDMLFFSTYQRPGELVYVNTPTLVYALSVPNAAGFAEAIKMHQRLEATAPTVATARRAGLWDLSLWRDPLAVLLIGLGIACVVALAAYLAYQMPALPDQVPVRLTPLGFIDRLGDKAQLFLLPLVAAVVLLLNVALSALLHRNERFGAYLALSGAVGMQLVLFMAAAQLIV